MPSVDVLLPVVVSGCVGQERRAGLLLELLDRQLGLQREGAAKAPLLILALLLGLGCLSLDR